MKIPVTGMDPSLDHWGIAQGHLDLETGILEDLDLKVIEPLKLNGKQVRVNSCDLHRAEQLGSVVYPAVKDAKAVFVEVPVGSQSARAMASYGICVGILGLIRALGVPLIEVSPTEVKVAFTGDKNASKKVMIDTAVSLYPEAKFPTHKRQPGKIIASAEHAADAIASIHAGVRTPFFQNLMRLYT